MGTYDALKTTTVHGAPIQRFTHTETQDGKACGYILVHWQGKWVTAWYRDGDREWAYGRYHDTRNAAEIDHWKRSKCIK